MNIEQEKMIVESLPSLYPLQKHEEDAINAVLDALPQWIPVTERLPEADMCRTLTTIRTQHKGTNVRSGHYYKGFFCNDNGDTWNATDKEVLAWMPLPESYKEVTG